MSRCGDRQTGPIGDGTGRTACGGPAWCPYFPNLLDCWFGLSYQIMEATVGQRCAESYGVGLGCAQCDDLPDRWVRGVPVDGVRFLMPYFKWAPEAPLYNAKDIHGNEHDLRSNEAWRVPLHIAYLRGNGFQQVPEPQECIRDACRYLRDQSGPVPGDDGFCGHGELVGEALKGILADTTGFTGYHMPDPRSPNMYQRHTKDRQLPHVVRFGSNYLFQTNFHRVFDCTANLLLGCLARLEPPGPCDCTRSYANKFDGRVCDLSPLPNPAPRYYVDSQVQDLYGFIRILRNSAQIRGNGTGFFSFGDASIAIKNAALSLIDNETLPGWSLAGGGSIPPIRFDQLDLNDRGIGLPEYEAWSRDWNVYLDGSLRAPASALPVLPSVPVRGRLRHSGLEFSPEPVLLWATIESSLVMIVKFDDSAAYDPDTGEIIFPDFITTFKVEPSVRIRITAQWGLRVAETIDRVFPDGRHVIISQGDIYNEPFPKVTGDAVDYFVNGKPLPLSRHIEWWGNLSSFSVPSAPDIIMPRIGGLNTTCTALTARLNQAGISVPGWPSYSDSFPDDPDRNSAFAGRIDLGFQELAA